MSNVMRAKLKVTHVGEVTGAEGQMQCQSLKFGAVYKDGAYPADGSDEDNTFALFTPSAEMSMTITNPALIGKFAEGQKFYVDFTSAE